MKVYKYIQEDIHNVVNSHRIAKHFKFVVNNTATQMLQVSDNQDDYILYKNKQCVCCILWFKEITSAEHGKPTSHTFLP